MNAPTLEVLNIQVEQIERQVQEIRRHLETHQLTAGGDSRAHLEHAAANCFGIETLASHVHACITCADKARNNRLALPVCANDKPTACQHEWKFARQAMGSSYVEHCEQCNSNRVVDQPYGAPPPAVDQVTGKAIPW